MAIHRLNHAVLYVRDAQAAAAFYQEALGFTVVMAFPGAVFMKTPAGENHHDLGLFSVGPSAAGPTRGRVGLYHLAWEVEAIEDLLVHRQRLVDMGALVGSSDNAVSKSLYAHDIDGNEFEVLWSVPSDHWTPEMIHGAPTLPLDLEAEVARWGAAAQPEAR